MCRGASDPIQQKPRFYAVKEGHALLAASFSCDGNSKSPEPSRFSVITSYSIHYTKLYDHGIICGVFNIAGILEKPHVGHAIIMAALLAGRNNFV